MANIKSAKKRVLVSKRRAVENKLIKSATKTFIKKVESLIHEKNKEEATKFFVILTRKLDQAVSKNIYHANTVARLKSRLALAINAL